MCSLPPRLWSLTGPRFVYCRGGHVALVVRHGLGGDPCLPKVLLASWPPSGTTSRSCRCRGKGRWKMIVLLGGRARELWAGCIWNVLRGQINKAKAVANFSEAHRGKAVLPRGGKGRGTKALCLLLTCGWDPGCWVPHVGAIRKRKKCTRSHPGRKVESWINSIL